MTSEWKPIESAPKDGRMLWLWYDGGKYLGQWRIPFAETDGYWSCCGEIVDEDGDRLTLVANYRGFAPSKWCPVPQPPKPQEDAAA